MHDPALPLRRSVLYVPASNERALLKSAALACDAIIFDLEDAVAPEEKASARERLRAFLAGPRHPECEIAVRINALSGAWGTEDFLAARAVRPDAILLPKVEEPADIAQAETALEETDAPRTIRLWAMIETPRGLMQAGAIAALGRAPDARLSCLVAGTNDLVKETGIDPGPERANLKPWLMQIVLAARAGSLGVLDGVSNDFRDLAAFAGECAAARAMGFDGKTLIHPAQIAAANSAFAPTAAEVAEAQAIVAAFARPENQGRGVVSLGGRMVERLHLRMAEALIARAKRIEEKDG